MLMNRICKTFEPRNEFISGNADLPRHGSPSGMVNGGDLYRDETHPAPGPCLVVVFHPFSDVTVLISEIRAHT